MSEYLIQSGTLGAIADAIRAKKGTTNAMIPAQMADEIAGITTVLTLSWHQCPEAVLEYLAAAQAAYPSDDTVTVIDQYAPSHGNENLAKTIPGAGGQPADIVCNLHQIASQSLQTTVGKDQLIFGGQSVELVAFGLEILAGELGDRFGNRRVKALGRVQAGTHSRAAQGQLFQLRQRQLQQLSVLFQAAPPAGDLLGEGNGGGIL